MTAPSPTLDPIQNSNLWHSFQLKGIVAPGTIPKGGIKGFKRQNGWDEKKGKGTAGATLTLVAAPPCKGSIKLQLFTAADFEAWDRFVADVLSIDAALQKTQGLSIYYPAFSSIGLTTVVVDSYTTPEHQGKGMYHVEIQFIEWTPPPAVNVTSTPQATAPDESGDGATAPPQVDPRITARQEEIEKLRKAAAP